MGDQALLQRTQALLYARILLEAISGPYSSMIRVEVGSAALPIFDALLVRVKGGLGASDGAIPIDDIDWAAIQSLAPVILRLYDPSTFQTVSGYAIEDLADLGRMAEATRREFRTPPHGISYRIGSCVVTLPTAFIEKGVMLVGAPDVESWNRVVPECARDRRAEFLDPLRTRFPRDDPSRLWEERSVESLEELGAWVRKEAEPFDRRRGRPEPRGQP